MAAVDYLSRLLRLRGAVAYPITGDVSVSVDDALEYRVFKVTGTLTADATITLPNEPGGDWFFANATTGGYDIDIDGASGSAIAIPSGEVRAIVCQDDGSLTTATSAPQAFDGEVPNGNFWSAADIYRWYAAGGVGVGDLLLELGNNLADFQGLAITTTGDVNAAYVETVGDVYANGEVWGSYIESTGGLVSVSSLTSKLTIAAESTATFPMPGTDASVSKITKVTRTSTGVALTYAIPDLKAVKIISGVLATKTGDAYSADFEYVVRRDGGTVTEKKSVKSNESSAAGPTVAYSISGTNVIATWTAVDVSSWNIMFDSTVAELA
jgi:hypothetical protein